MGLAILVLIFILFLITFVVRDSSGPFKDGEL